MFSDEDLSTNLKYVHASKTDGADPTSYDCFKHTTDLMINFMKWKVNLILSHGQTPTTTSFMRATVVHIRKNIRLDLARPVITGLLHWFE